MFANYFHIKIERGDSSKISPFSNFFEKLTFINLSTNLKSFFKRHSFFQTSDYSFLQIDLLVMHQRIHYK